MKTWPTLPAVVALTALAVGCATPTPRDLEVAESGGEQVKELFGSLAEAIRQQDAGLLKSLLSPTLKQRDAARLQVRVGQASWLERYSGYTPDIESALAGIHWEEWKQGRFSLEVSASNIFGDRLEDAFELVSVEGQWRILDVKMAEPQKGDLLNPPQRVKEDLMPQVRLILQLLKEGKTGTIYRELLHEDARRFRKPTLSWWQRWTAGAPPQISIYADLQSTRQFRFSDWPDADQEVAFAYAAPNGVTAVYEVEYTWPGAGIEEADLLRIELTFFPTEEGWVFFGIGLFGKGIVYS